MLSKLDLNLLVVLDAVLSERSVARAAVRLHVTPSAISNALARLRAALGDPLVARKGRGIVPTPRALELAPLLGRTLRELDSALNGSAFDPRTSTRSFTLAIADVGQVVYLPRIAALLRAQMPHVRLRVIGVASLVALGGVASTEVDAAVGVPERAPGVHALPLFSEPLVLATRATKRARVKHSPSALAAREHVAIDMIPGQGYRDTLAQVYARAGVPRVVAMTVPTFSAAASIVAATDYVATLPASLLSALGPRMGLCQVTGPVPEHAVMMQLSWHERTHGDPAHRAFRALLQRALAPAIERSARSAAREQRRS